jgi:tryptophan synthase alpha chain
VSARADGGEARIAAAFARCRADGRAAFVPYLTAGFPDGPRSLAAARTLLQHADLLELGLPFSDPLGDGPTIQRASEVALRAGASTAGLMRMLRTLRAETSAPLVVMTYYNPIYCYRGPAGEGEDAFVADLRAAGADGVILPDLPPDEGETLIAAARRHDLATIFLVAPTSTDARLRLVSAASRGFIYAVSVTGVTGARDAVGAEIGDLVRRTKAHGDLPVAVGFGVSTPANAADVAGFADGVVVGSRLVQAIADDDDVGSLAAALAAACRRPTAES